MWRTNRVKLIIYHCYGGSHSSVTAAGMQNGMLPRDRVATSQELLQIPHFDRFEPVVHGHFRFIGWDREKVVYVLGKKLLGSQVNRLLKGAAALAGCGERIFAVDTTAPVNLLMVIGGFLSRRLNLVALGRPLVLWGTRLAYSSLLHLVEETERLVTCCQTVAEQRPAVMPRLIFYVCGRFCRSGLLAAGAVLGLREDRLLNWACNHSFDGKLGSFCYLGSLWGYEHYLVGGGNDPRLVSRILQDFSRLLEIPHLYWQVVEIPLPAGFFSVLLPAVMSKMGFKGVSCLWERHLLKRMLKQTQNSAILQIKRILEGIP